MRVNGYQVYSSNEQSACIFGLKFEKKVVQFTPNNWHIAYTFAVKLNWHENEF